MSRFRDLDSLERSVVRCRKCPRLVEWRETSAREPPRRHAGEGYWGRPVPGFGDPAAWLFVVGLAPAAHGGNRTGRVFTGDRSGDWLYRALHRAGLANQPASVSRDDGLALTGVWVAASVRCAPPDNKPLPEERDRCRPYLEAEFDLLSGVRVVVALGKFAFEVVLGVARDRGLEIPRPRPVFGHGAEAEIGPGRLRLLGSFHPSQQNTFTGRLTEEMFDSVFRRAVALR